MAPPVTRVGTQENVTSDVTYPDSGGGPRALYKNNSRTYLRRFRARFIVNVDRADPARTAAFVIL